MNDIKYIAEWTQIHTTSVHLKLNRDTDADILLWLDEQPSKNGAIKDAIRAYINAISK